MQTNQQKQTKTYGLVGFDAPFRQGRSLSLPTLPFQKTNRYAVVSTMQATNRPLTINILAWGPLLKSKPLRGSWYNATHE